MMRLGDTRTLSAPRRRTPVAEMLLDELLRIPHTASILARLAVISGDESSGIEALRMLAQDATERDILAATRPAGCWCFGRGGLGERAVMVPGADVPMVLSTYCTCPAGGARRELDDQARSNSRAYADQLRVASLWEVARIPERFNTCTLDTFPVTTHPMRNVINRLRDWATTSEWAVVLHGGFGVGKTGLGIGVLKVAAGRRQVGLFVKAPDLLSRMRSTYGKTTDVTELELLDSLRTVPLLMLDDLGADRATDWATEMLFQVLDGRHDANLKTIVTTNLALAELAVHLGPRTMHRFDEGAVFMNVDGPNLRKDQKGNVTSAT